MVIHVQFAFQSSLSLQHVESMAQLHRTSLSQMRKMNMENHSSLTYMYLFSVDYSISYFLFFILFLSPLFCNCAFYYFEKNGIFPYSLSSHILLSVVNFSKFIFFPLPEPFFYFCHLDSLFIFWYIHCMSVVFFFCFFSFLPKSLPFHSIGTREVVIQKNLCGLVPFRDFRLDPSLLYSIPLLALSPNLLIVWLFLSIAYLVAKLRCKWSKINQAKIQ